MGRSRPITTKRRKVTIRLVAEMVMRRLPPMGTPPGAQAMPLGDTARAFGDWTGGKVSTATFPCRQSTLP